MATKKETTAKVEKKEALKGFKVGKATYPTKQRAINYAIRELGKTKEEAEELVKAL